MVSCGLAFWVGLVTWSVVDWHSWSGLCVMVFAVDWHCCWRTRKFFLEAGTRPSLCYFVVWGTTNNAVGARRVAGVIQESRSRLLLVCGLQLGFGRKFNYWQMGLGLELELEPRMCAHLMCSNGNEPVCIDIPSQEMPCPQATAQSSSDFPVLKKMPCP